MTVLSAENPKAGNGNAPKIFEGFPNFTQRCPQQGNELLHPPAQPSLMRPSPGIFKTMPEKLLRKKRLTEKLLLKITTA